MEEYFTSGGEDYYGGVDMTSTWVWQNKWAVLLVVVIVSLFWYLALYFAGIMTLDFKKQSFSNKEGLKPGMFAIRDDTGFPSTDSLAEQARARERLVESGRDPNLYRPDPVELATQLALRAGGQATNLNDQEETETAELRAAMEANAAAGAATFRNRSRFTERMTPEEEVRAKQAAMVGL